MRQQAKELVVGKVYADTKGDIYEPVFMRFVKYIGDEIAAFSYVSGSKIYPTNQEGLSCFLSSQSWYELTSKDEKEFNVTPDTLTFTEDDIYEVIDAVIAKSTEQTILGRIAEADGLLDAARIIKSKLQLDNK